MPTSIDLPESRSRARALARRSQPRGAEEPEGAAAFQGRRSPVVPAVVAEGFRYRKPCARPLYERGRGKHRRHPAPSDGRAKGLPPRLLGPRGGRRSRIMSERPAEEPTFTEDRLLGGRIRVKQPAAGYRVAIDPLFLAAAVPAEPHQLV